MTPDEHRRHLTSEGAAVAVAARGGLDAAVPSCPGWTVTDLVAHVGFVHTWARMQVDTGPDERVRFRDVGEAGQPPEDPDLVAWYEAGLAALVDALDRLDPIARLPSWAGVQPGSWFPRRMAHETAVHRWDAEHATGAGAPFDPALAADGIDEHLELFLARIPPERVDRSGTIALRATDTADAWLLRMAPGSLDGGRGSGDADVAVAAPASDLLLLVWNRRSGDDLRHHVIGDRSVLASWSEIVRI